ncbi:MAG: HAD-IA family hydrolase [Deltaproteobacteria bacterium]|nr:HAD-IA family hydrolase [Deltaproteobacteria bacterium]
MMTKPKVLIFDIDDTLVDTTPSYRGSIIQTARHFGGTVNMADIARAKAEGDANNDWVLTKDLLADQGIDVPLDEVTRVFEDLYQGKGNIPGLKRRETLLLERDTILLLKTMYRLGVVTGRPRRDAEDFLVQHQLGDVFEVMVTMDDGPLKPNPFPVQKALEAMGETDAWMIGDTPDDIRSAVGAGIVAIGVIAPADDPDEARQAMLDAGAKMVLKRTVELKDILL